MGRRKRCCRGSPRTSIRSWPPFPKAACKQVSLISTCSQCLVREAIRVSLPASRLSSRRLTRVHRSRTSRAKAIECHSMMRCRKRVRCSGYNSRPLNSLPEAVRIRATTWVRVASTSSRSWTAAARWPPPSGRAQSVAAPNKLRDQGERSHSARRENKAKGALACRGLDRLRTRSR